MGFLGKLFGGGSARGDESGFVTAVAADPTCAPAIAAMQQMNIMPALQLFQASGHDPELRYRLVEAAATMYGPKDTRAMTLDAWVNNTPNDPYAVLVRARWRIKSAPSWKPNDPKDVADRARAANTAAAKFAASDYQRIAKADPRDALPLALELELPLIYKLPELKRLYGEVLQRAPDFFEAHLSMHHWLSAMWYGDHAQSVGFMREVAARAPIGSDVHVLVVFGHLSVYQHEKFYGDEKDPARLGRVINAASAEVNNCLERSLWSPQHQPGRWTPWAHHVAACWFYEAGDRARAKAELAAVGNVFDASKSPWYLSAKRYGEIRTQLGL